MLPLKRRLWPGTPGRQLSNGMKIGIIGAGKVGGGLGKLWVRAGHQVLFSSRHPKRLRVLVKEACCDRRIAAALVPHRTRTRFPLRLMVIQSVISSNFCDR